MTQSEILAMPATEYMNQPQLEFFRALLREKFDAAVAATDDARKAIAGLGVVPDEVDQASIEEERVALSRTLARLNSQVQALTYSLKSISEGDYGWCEDTGQAIGLARLLAQPTARFTAEAQAARESRSRHYIAA